MTLIDTTNDIARAVNIVLGLYIVLRAVLDYKRFFDASRSYRAVRFAGIIFVLAIVWSSAETIVSSNTAPGVRSWVNTLVLVWYQYATVLDNRDNTYGGPGDER